MGRAFAESLSKPSYGANSALGEHYGTLPYVPSNALLHLDNIARARGNNSAGAHDSLAAFVSERDLGVKYL